MTASASVKSRPAQSKIVASRDTDISPENLKKWKKARNDRKLSYIGQAFLLFNVWGIPLSYGPYLKIYYDDTWEQSVLRVSSIIAVQLICIFGVGFPVLWLYQRGYWRSPIIIASVTAIACQWVLYTCARWTARLLVQGLGLGISLGTLYSTGTLILGSHHKNNHPLTSMISVSAGLLGAIFYTSIATGPTISASLLKTAYICNATLTTVTLLLACLLVRRSDVTFTTTTHTITPLGSTSYTTTTITSNNYSTLKYALPQPGHRNPILEPSTRLFILGYIVTFAGIFIYPLYSILHLSFYPSHARPVTPLLYLLATYTSATLTAPIVANKHLRTTLGPVNTLISATIIAAASIIVPAWLPYPAVALPFHIIYGIALGAILALHSKALAVFHWSTFSYHDDMFARAAVTQMIAGVFVGAGVLWTGWVVDHTGQRGRLVFRGVELGFGVCGTVVAYVLFGGAVLMALARWRRCPGLWVAV